MIHDFVGESFHSCGGDPHVFIPVSKTLRPYEQYYGGKKRGKFCIVSYRNIPGKVYTGLYIKSFRLVTFRNDFGYNESVSTLCINYIVLLY